MSTERVFTAAELERFLRAVDQHLDVPRAIKLIGGSAAALAYRIESGTTDVDLFESKLQLLEAAFERARQVTGLAIPVSEPPGVADVPWNYEDRLQRVLPDLSRLTVWALEKHDLALSKIVRGDEHDFTALEELHGKDPLDESTLVT